MIGLFIGSFNPPTLAHLEIALRLKNKYEKIVFVPVNSREKHLVSIEDRINMLMIYHFKYPFIEVNDIMKNYAYLNYRIIDVLKKKYEHIELILGDDLWDKLSTFDAYDYLLEHYSFMVITRHNSFLTKQGIYMQVMNYQNNISSTLVREKIKKQESVKNMLDDDVYLYIQNKQLYF